MTEISNIISMKLKPHHLLHAHTPKLPIIHWDLNGRWPLDNKWNVLQKKSKTDIWLLVSNFY